MFEWRQVTRAVDSSQAAKGSPPLHTLQVAASTAELARQQAEAEWREEALYWYAVAHDRGLVIAAYHYAKMLLIRGGDGDAVVACRVLMRAASSEPDADTAWQLSSLMRQGVGCRRNEASAVKWRAVAAHLGHPEALAATS